MTGAHHPADFRRCSGLQHHRCLNNRIRHLTKYLAAPLGDNPACFAALRHLRRPVDNGSPKAVFARSTHPCTVHAISIPYILQSAVRSPHTCHWTTTVASCKEPARPSGLLCTHIAPVSRVVHLYASTHAQAAGSLDLHSAADRRPGLGHGAASAWRAHSEQRRLGCCCKRRRRCDQDLGHTWV